MPETERHFPCLKKINLECIKYFDTESLMNLISLCPVLEELCLDRLQLSNISYMCKVSSPSLKRLTIKSSDFRVCKLVIDAPKLEYIFVNSYINYTLKNPMSLVEAHIGDRFGDVKLLKCVSNVKILTLTCPAVNHLQIHRINLPMFPNLVKLVIAWEENLLFPLLNNMPNLEYLTISDGIYPFGCELDPSEDTPTCLRFKMKEILIVARVKWVEVPIIRYLVKHANILEKLTFDKVDFECRKALMNIPCGSEFCRIEFV